MLMAKTKIEPLRASDPPANGQPALDGSLPRVLLIGDSIRVGYQEFVRRELAGTADVRSNQVAAGNSRYFLAYLAAWLQQHQPHVVHVNAGLHDVRRSFETGTLLVPPQEYRRNIHEITRLIRGSEIRDSRPEGVTAQVIWATTTPIDESKHTATHRLLGDFLRRSVNITSYNATLGQLGADLRFAVNDLHQVVTDAGANTIHTDDGYHFTAAGCALLAAAVARAVRRYLLSA